MNASPDYIAEARELVKRTRQEYYSMPRLFKIIEKLLQRIDELEAALNVALEAAELEISNPREFHPEWTVEKAVGEEPAAQPVIPARSELEAERAAREGKEKP